MQLLFINFQLRLGPNAGNGTAPGSERENEIEIVLCNNQMVGRHIFLVVFLFVPFHFFLGPSLCYSFLPSSLDLNKASVKRKQ